MTIINVKEWMATKPEDLKDLITNSKINDLYELQEELESMKNELNTLKKVLNDAFDERFSKTASDSLDKEGKQFGTTHLYEDNYCVTVTMPKKVEWNQEELDSIMKVISEEDRRKYIKTTYDINEQKYLNHWPESLKNVVSSARNVIMGTPKYLIATKD
ncbi:hypothetical protein UFOVP97_17 [uncultured Caudovirales phage]|uniref:Uncharacterized protein n=1 Tax=uncultured Caudovirales phage TaxID=2100421 RepID=A0A6J5L040_9CAUD|nr:hypothetical protein UFOVP97_17 [uncultured Caudovirales phage]CAB4134252.1 hypothetical protein UFOVP268_35 [uncultured Caudovirales phage]